MEKLTRFVLLIGMPLAIWHSYLVGDAVGFLSPEFARIFFWHFPFPIMMTGLLIAGLWFSIQTLRTRSREWDLRAQSAHELALMFILLTMMSGIFFSRVQWNAWWQNDPRQVSFLLVVTIFIAYFVLRSAFTDPDKRAINSSGYAVAAFLPTIYLTYVYPRLPQVMSSHPNESIMKGNIKGGYAVVIIELLILVCILTWWIYKLRSRALLLEYNTENLYADLESPRRSDVNAPVVRSLHDADPNGSGN